MHPKIDVQGPDDCWEWTGTRLPKGYGTYGLRGKPVYAHRQAWSEYHDATIPPGMVIMHTCDNPPCCNPAHLRLGTYRDNVIDMFNKGRGGHRGNPGAINGGAKVTAEIVATIRAEYAAGNTTQMALAKKFGLGQSQINRIVRNMSWVM